MRLRIEAERVLTENTVLENVSAETVFEGPAVCAGHQTLIYFC